MAADISLLACMRIPLYAQLLFILSARFPSIVLQLCSNHLLTNQCVLTVQHSVPAHHHYLCALAHHTSACMPIYLAAAALLEFFLSKFVQSMVDYCVTRLLRSYASSSSIQLQDGNELVLNLGLPVSSLHSCTIIFLYNAILFHYSQCGVHYIFSKLIYLLYSLDRCIARLWNPLYQ